MKQLLLYSNSETNTPPEDIHAEVATLSIK